MKLLKTKFETLRGGKVIRGIEYRPEEENLLITIVSHGILSGAGHGFKKRDDQIALQHIREFLPGR